MTRHPQPEYPQTPGNPDPKTQYIAIEGELEELEIINEDLPTDEIEMKARRIIFDIRSRLYSTIEQKKFPSSGDLLLIAHDEWKRRQERKGFDDEIPWVSGWISGYLTSKKFVNEQLIKLRTAREQT